MQQIKQSISLTVSANQDWVPLLQCAAQTAAQVFGLDDKKSLRLTMGVEEVTLYLSQEQPGAAVSIFLEQCISRVQARFVLTADSTDLSAMNVVAGNDSDAAADNNLSLLLASRMSDGLSVIREGKDIHLILLQEHVYPSIEPVYSDSPDKDYSPALTVKTTRDANLISNACAQALGIFPLEQVPAWFSTPGKGVDLIMAEELYAATAMDEKGRVCGLICWEHVSEKSVMFSGPWVFRGGEQCTSILLEHLIVSLARSRAVCLFSDLRVNPFVELENHGFEQLSEIASSSETHKRKVWFRHLCEDEGLCIWSHPQCTSFLQQSYDRLYIARTIQKTVDSGSHTYDRSLFSAELNPEKKEAILTPLLDGQDNEENIQRHINALTADGYSRIVFRIDLAHGWQAHLGGTLLKQGFSPVMVLPHAGMGDILVFEYV